MLLLDLCRSLLQRLPHRLPVHLRPRLQPPTHLPLGQFSSCCSCWCCWIIYGCLVVSVLLGGSSGELSIEDEVSLLDDLQDGLVLVLLEEEVVGVDGVAGEIRVSQGGQEDELEVASVTLKG
jgi:hypothetical protein